MATAAATTPGLDAAEGPLGAPPSVCRPSPAETQSWGSALRHPLAWSHSSRPV